MCFDVQLPVNWLDTIGEVTISRGASRQATRCGRRIRRMVTSGTTIRRGTCTSCLLCCVTRTWASRGFNALLGVIFVLSSGFNRSRRTVRRGHRVSAGRLCTYKTQRARIFLYCLLKICFLWYLLKYAELFIRKKKTTVFSVPFTRAFYNQLLISTYLLVYE